MPSGVQLQQRADSAPPRNDGQVLPESELTTDSLEKATRSQTLEVTTIIEKGNQTAVPTLTMLDQATIFANSLTEEKTAGTGKVSQELMSDLLNARNSDAVRR